MRLYHLQFRFHHSIIGSNYKTIFGTSVAFSPRVYIRPIVRPSFLTQECRLRSRHSADRREKGKEKEGNVQVMAFQHAKRPKKPSKLDDTLRVELKKKKKNQTQQIHTSLSLSLAHFEKSGR